VFWSLLTGHCFLGYFKSSQESLDTIHEQVAISRPSRILRSYPLSWRNVPANCFSIRGRLRKKLITYLCSICQHASIVILYAVSDITDRLEIHKINWKKGLSYFVLWKRSRRFFPFANRNHNHQKFPSNYGKNFSFTRN